MNLDEVLAFYNALEANGVAIWVDGGWGVDALLGKQTRHHEDLDLAVSREHHPMLQQFLAKQGWEHCQRDGSKEWNYVVANESNLVDVHVFEFDAEGTNTYGVAYPQDSLTGVGSLRGQSVRCIAAESMFKFKTSFLPRPRDVADVQALAAKFGLELPEGYH